MWLVGWKSGPLGANTQDAKKVTTMFMRRALVGCVVVSAVFGFALVGCAGEADSGDESGVQQSEESQGYSESSEQAPEEAYYKNEYRNENGEVRKQLTNVKDQSDYIFSEEYQIGGLYSEGLIFVTWETGDYDERWDAKMDKRVHCGYIDKDGNLVFEVEETANASDIMVVNSNGDADFINGRAKIKYTVENHDNADDHNGIQHEIVIDKNGKTVLSNNGVEEISLRRNDRGFQQFHDKRSEKSESHYFDFDGNSLDSEIQSGDRIYGEFSTRGDGDDTVILKNGEVIFRLSDLKASEGSEGIRLPHISSTGLAVVDLGKTVDGRPKWIQGVYNFVENEWTIEPRSNDYEFGAFEGNLVCVNYEPPFGDTACALMDCETGEWVIALETTLQNEYITSIEKHRDGFLLLKSKNHTSMLDASDGSIYSCDNYVK